MNEYRVTLSYNRTGRLNTAHLSTAQCLPAPHWETRGVYSLGPEELDLEFDDEKYPSHNMWIIVTAVTWRPDKPWSEQKRLVDELNDLFREKRIQFQVSDRWPALEWKTYPILQEVCSLLTP